MNEFVVINNLDTNPVAAYRMDALPLHVTLSNTFYSAEDPSILSDKLRVLSESLQPFMVTAGERQWFGVNNDVPVTEVEESEALNRLHMEIINSFGGAIALKSPQFAKENYRPHISDQPVGKVATGTHIVINNLTLVRVDGADVAVQAIHELKDT